MKLKKYFYVASLHFNNITCQEGFAPLPAIAYEVLFVSKRLGVPGGAGRGGAALYQTSSRPTSPGLGTARLRPGDGCRLAA